MNSQWPVVFDSDTGETKVVVTGGPEGIAVQHASGHDGYMFEPGEVPTLDEVFDFCFLLVGPPVDLWDWAPELQRCLP